MASEDHNIEIVDWETHRDKLRAIRDKVFIQEQEVPEAVEIDGCDDTATHFLVTLNGVAVGCGRLLEDGKITRMALLPEHRGAGVGRLLLERMVEHARGLGLMRVYLHAQDHAAPFYGKAGFVQEGDGFEEASIPHHVMAMQLKAEAGAGAAANRAVSGVRYPEPFATLAIELISGARRHLRIFSPRLDHEVFDRAAMCDAIALVARNSRYCDIRILISDSKPLVKRGHRVLTLARRLPSSIHIQRLSKHPDLPDDSFIVRDSNGTIHKPIDADREGFYEPDSPATAKRFIEQFDELWRKSKPDPELRILRL